MALFGGPNVEKLAEERDYPGLAKALTSNDAGTRDKARAALIEIGDPSSVQPIVERVTGQKDEAVIVAGADVLRSFGEQAVPTLRMGLRGVPPAEKPAYSALLGRMGEPDGLAPLLEASNEADTNVRGAAVMGLGLIVSPASTERLIEVLKSDEDLDTRGFAALSLAAHKHPGAYDAFVAELDDAEPVSRALGAMGLGMLGDNRAAERLQQVATADADERVRERAQAALSDLANPS